MFIALEGIDGSGKSTQISLLKAKLEAESIPVYSTCEPTRNDYGKEIRKIFSQEKIVDQHTIAALFLADRLEHILHPQSGMKAQIDRGYTVITDRYYLSSYAYHGAHVDMDWVIDINAKPAELLKPDLHIYLDITPESAMDRILSSREDIELYETASNLKAVHQSYEIAMEKVKNTENIIRLNANRSADQIHEDIWEQVRKIVMK